MTGPEVAQKRKWRGLRGVDVAKELGVTQPTISRWERRVDLPKRISYAMMYAILVLGGATDV